MQSVTLLIDKRLELSTKYKKLLENSSNIVYISKDFITALKIIQDNEPDLIIISDSLDGEIVDYCRKIRALTYNMRPVIVATSKSSEVADRLKVLDAGADDFISEPVNSDEFVMRMKAHLRREFESNTDERSGIPNKNYSLKVLKRVIKSDIKWATLLISIDNLSSYKETYTELASDKVISTFSAIIFSVLGENDYFGQISENEFLIVTDMYKADKIANFLTFAFESVSSKFYSQQDIKRGYVILQGDEFAGRRAELIHSTIGVVTNEFNNFDNVTQLINALVQTVNMARKPNYSNYIIERPKITAEDSVIKKEYNNKIAIIEPDEAMNVLLKTIFELQGYEVVFEKDSPAIIILDAGDVDEQKGLELCRQFKSDRAYENTKLIVTSILHDKETVLNAGADLYLPKPYEIPNLVKWVDLFIREFNR